VISFDHRATVTDRRITELREEAVTALADAEFLFRRTELSDQEEDGWTSAFAEMLADGMADPVPDRRLRVACTVRCLHE
jgi:hypothetical protein